MGADEHSFLGTGWRFPPKFNMEGPTTEMVNDEEDIRQSLYIILSTRKGERIRNPEFGCGIYDLAFEDMDTSIHFRIKDLVSTAILYYEPRIKLLTIDVNLSQQVEGRLNISIDYLIRTVNKRSNMVFPFYFLEGTDLRF